MFVYYDYVFCCGVALELPAALCIIEERAFKLIVALYHKSCENALQRLISVDTARAERLLVDALRTSELEADVATLKADMVSVKTDVAELKANVAQILAILNDIRSRGALSPPT